jgi:catechol 2,3-dioxygenase-like lactoylglutathione lyase family enzyme
VFDHVGLNVRDYATSRAFYEAALAPLGYRVVFTFEGISAGFGAGDRGRFWVNQREPHGTGTHVAFEAAERSAVDAFYEAAIAAGGRDNGAPGPREHYAPNYYGAFVLDPDGNNIEAVCRKPA